jgi:hypothetical protein
VIDANIPMLAALRERLRLELAAPAVTVEHARD